MEPNMSTNVQPAPNFAIGFDPSYLPSFEDKMFLEGPQTRRRLVNFFALLIFATIIATYGVLSDSTATVIGAMIVAPLMGPIMATTAAVVMGHSQRALSAFGLTVAGIGTVILLGYLLAGIVPDVTISFTANGEIASRINPGLYALLTALGAGAAGAFITSRAEIADSMGGVAIAISLVPPLCVVGISIEQGQMAAAQGAMLLFLTNYLAILLAGGVVFFVTGLAKTIGAQGDVKIRRRGLALFILGVVIVSIPLSLTSYEAVSRSLDTQAATQEANEWLEGTNYQVASLSLNDKSVIMTVEGSGDLNPVQVLAERLAETLNRPVVVKLRTLPVQVGEAGVSTP
jgi:uncharacterized hydrophobic protein (TIGR00271 family)